MTRETQKTLNRQTLALMRSLEDVPSDVELNDPRLVLLLTHLKKYETISDHILSLRFTHRFVSIQKEMFRKLDSVIDKTDKTKILLHLLEQVNRLSTPSGKEIQKICEDRVRKAILLPGKLRDAVHVASDMLILAPRPCTSGFSATECVVKHALLSRTFGYSPSDSIIAVLSLLKKETIGHPYEPTYREVTRLAKEIPRSNHAPSVKFHLCAQLSQNNAFTLSDAFPNARKATLSIGNALIESLRQYESGADVFRDVIPFWEGLSPDQQKLFQNIGLSGLLFSIARKMQKTKTLSRTNANWLAENFAPNDLRGVRLFRLSTRLRWEKLPPPADREQESAGRRHLLSNLQKAAGRTFGPLCGVVDLGNGWLHDPDVLARCNLALKREYGETPQHPAGFHPSYFLRYTLKRLTNSKK